MRAEGTVELTREQPVVAVEFEASFESFRSSGIYAQLFEIRPRTPDELSGVKAFQRDVWNGDAWAPIQGDGPEITGLGVNTFRYRWILELADGTPEATIPFEVDINPTWGDGSDAPLPDEQDVTDLAVSVTSVYPLAGR